MITRRQYLRGVAALTLAGQSRWGLQASPRSLATSPDEKASPLRAPARYVNVFTGIGDMLDVLLIPAQGAVFPQPGDRSGPDNNYFSRFDGVEASSPLTPDEPGHHGPGYDRGAEFVESGYRRVKLTDHDIQVELTATPRAAACSPSRPKAMARADPTYSR